MECARLDILPIQPPIFAIHVPPLARTAVKIPITVLLVSLGSIILTLFAIRSALMDTLSMGLYVPLVLLNASFVSMMIVTVRCVRILFRLFFFSPHAFIIAQPDITKIRTIQPSTTLVNNVI